MAVHFLHIPKCGGSALRSALFRPDAVRPLRKLAPICDCMRRRPRRRPCFTGLDSPYGRIYTHRHEFRLADVGPDDKVIFVARDPISRFISAYYSRYHRGAPRYEVEWTEREAKAFAAFPTPQALAEALGERGELGKSAKKAMKSIRHLQKPLTWWTGNARELKKSTPQILYIARQETLAEDWERIKALLELPPDVDLPRDPRIAHSLTTPVDRTMTPEGERKLRKLLSEDYRVLEVCEKFRSGAVGPARGLMWRVGARR